MKKLKMRAILLAMVVLAVFSACSNDDENENSNPLNGDAIVGTWSVLMDDPSWHTILELKVDGTCVGTDYYDIKGDKTFAEFSGTSYGTYSVTADGISFEFAPDKFSILVGSYRFKKISETYFEAADSDDWYIYATKID